MRGSSMTPSRRKSSPLVQPRAELNFRPESSQTLLLLTPRRRHHAVTATAGTGRGDAVTLKKRRSALPDKRHRGRVRADKQPRRQHARGQTTRTAQARVVGEQRAHSPAASMPAAKPGSCTRTCRTPYHREGHRVVAKEGCPQPLQQVSAPVGWTRPTADPGPRGPQVLPRRRSRPPKSTDEAGLPWCAATASASAGTAEDVATRAAAAALTRTAPSRCLAS